MAVVNSESFEHDAVFVLLLGIALLSIGFGLVWLVAVLLNYLFLLFQTSDNYKDELHQHDQIIANTGNALKTERA